MKTYAKIKFLSRCLIGLAIFCVASSAIVFAISSNKIGADVNSSTGGTASGGTVDKSTGKLSSLPTYKVVGNGVKADLIMVDVSIPEIADFTYTKTASDGSTTFPYSNYGITKSIDDKACGGIRRTNGFCYILVYNNVWDRPSVLTPVAPSWIFLDEIMKRAEAASEATDKGIIQNAMTSYAGDALRYWKGVNLDQIYYDHGQVVISSNELIGHLSAEKLATGDPYVTDNLSDKLNGGNKTVTIKLGSTYPLATKNSLWLDAVEMVLGSVIKVWQSDPYNVDLNYEEQTLLEHRANYINYADVATSSSNVSGSALSITGPGRIIIDAGGAATTAGSFKMTIDPTKFPKPAPGYKTQIYLKPSAKSSQNVFTYLHSTDPTYSFSWADIMSAPYATSIDGSGNPVIYDGTAADKTLEASGDMSYEKKFPQKYVVTVVTYTQDSAGKEVEKERISTNFDTISSSSFDISPQTATANIPGGNSTMSMTVDRSTYSSTTQGPVQYETQLHDEGVAKMMNKVVVWVCRGSAPAVVSGDSTTCTSGEVELVKAAFAVDGLAGSEASWKKFSYDSSGNATLTGEWDIAGTTPGTYSLMAKAHRSSEAGTYIEGSKVAVTVTLTNAAITETALNEKLANLLDFGGAASTKARGSTITTLTAAATRVVNILLAIIGAFAVIAILIGGIMYISSGGDQAKAEKGKKTIIYAVYGIAIALSGFFIEYIVLDLIKQILK